MCQGPKRGEREQKGEKKVAGVVENEDEVNKNESNVTKIHKETWDRDACDAFVFTDSYTQEES